MLSASNNFIISLKGFFLAAVSLLLLISFFKASNAFTLFSSGNLVRLSANTLNIASLEIIPSCDIFTTFTGTKPLYSGFLDQNSSKVGLLAS